MASSIRPVAGSIAVATFDFAGADESELTFDPGDVWEVTRQINAEWQKGKLKGREGIYPVAFANAAEIAIAVADYSSKEPGDLSFKSGDEIVITKRVNPEWLEGAHSVSKKMGIFPKNFIQFTEPQKCPYARSLYQYEANQDDELSFEEECFIILLERVGSEWYKGAYAGAVGIFPANFVKPVRDLPKEAKGTKSPSKPPPPKSSKPLKAAKPPAPKSAKSPPPKATKSSPPQPAAKPSSRIPATAKPSPPKVANKPKVAVKPSSAKAVKPPLPKTVKPASPKPSLTPPVPVAKMRSPTSAESRPQSLVVASSTTSPTARHRDATVDPVSTPTNTGTPVPRSPQPRRRPPPLTQSVATDRTKKPPPPKARAGGAKPPAPKSRAAIGEAPVSKGGRPPRPKYRVSNTKPSRPDRRASVVSVEDIKDDSEEEESRRQMAEVEKAIADAEDELEVVSEKHAGFLAIINHMEQTEGADPDALANVKSLMAAAKSEVDILEDRLLVLYSKREDRNRIIQEVLETERDLYSDLKLCIEAYVAPTSLLMSAKDTEGNHLMSEELRDRLFCNIEDVLAVSTLIMSGLEETMRRDHEGMMIGRIFTQIAARMKDVYVTYVVNFDEAQVALAEIHADPVMKRILDVCQESVASRTKCWDLNSFLIKPVQRVLKYPLLLQELRKKTSTTHPDHDQLDIAFEKLSDVASAINEKKRTKELLDRYVQKSEQRNPHGIIHSIGKKSMRLNQKLRMKVSSAGEGYEEYARHEKALRDIESDCKRLRKLVEDYIRAKEESASTLESFTKTVYELFLGKHFKCTTSVEASTQMSEICLAFTNVSKHIHKHVEDVRSYVLPALSTVLHNLTNPLILIAKRADKRLDYESYRRRYDGAANNPEKQFLIEPELKLAKNTFAALHDQLEEDLPKLNQLCFQTLGSCMQTLGALHFELSRLADHECGIISNDYAAAKTREALSAQFKANIKPVTLNMSAIPIPRQGSKDAISSPPTSPVSRNDASRGISGPQFGNAVCGWDFQAMNDTEISLAAGERVSVIERSDDTGNPEWCKVETVDGKQGFVATDYLSGLEEESVTDVSVPDEESPSNSNFATAVAEYDFEAGNEGELSIIEGQELAVLELEDPDGNSEWCLVRNPDGDEGYVPAVYISLNSSVNKTV